MSLLRTPIRAAAVGLGLCVVALTAGCAARGGLSRADAEAAMRVKTAIVNDAEVGTEDVRVHVERGVAHLTGRISARDREARLVAIASATPGIREVRADFQVHPHVGAVARQLSVEPPVIDSSHPRHLIAVGASLRVTRSARSQLDDAVDVAPVVWLRPGNGFGPAIGFGWGTRDLETGPTGAPALARLRIRPLMGGLSYTKPLGRSHLSFSLVGGYAFTRLSVDDTRAGPDRAIGVSNTFAWRPSASLLVDLTDRFGVQFSAGYLVVRPKVTFANDRSVTSERVRADGLMMSIALGYWVF
ncbi:MAG TPA: BON domain-containing protein [Vicinamibacterales bacterium]